VQTEQIIQAENQATDIVRVAVTAIPTLNQLGEPTMLEKLRETLEPNLELCRQIEVRDEKGKAACNALIGAVKPLGQKLDEARRAINRACKETIDGRFLPLIKDVENAVGLADKQRRAYDTQQMEIARQRQREAEERAAKERAKLERRRKIQEAAVEAGKQARTEIAAPETVQTEIVSAPANILENRRQHYRLKYEVVNIDDVPDEFVTRIPKGRELQAKTLEIEKTYDKDRRGLDEPEQPVPGVRFFWESVYQDC
jgi:hypothetical protein